MGVTLLQGTAAKKKKKERQAAEAAYDVSRYVPPLKRIVDEALSAGLSANEYPFSTPREASPSQVGLADKDVKSSRSGLSTGWS